MAIPAGEEHSQDQHWAGLMARAQGGDECCYRQLLAELADVISAYLRRRLGNQHFVEDCVQDCLIAIHQARHTYDGRRPFRPWLFAIVRHKAIDHLRRQRSRDKLAEAHLNQSRVQAEGACHSPMENQLSQGQLLQALSPQYREAITLTKIIGLSSAEAAAQLAISESALKVRVHRATRRLRKLLEAERP